MNYLTRVLVHAGTMLALMSPLTSLAAETNTETAKETADKDPGSMKSLDQLAREMSNPLAPFFSATYKLEYRTYQGDMPDAKDQTSTFHVLEAVFPFRQKDGQGFVFRRLKYLRVGDLQGRVVYKGPKTMMIIKP